MKKPTKSAPKTPRKDQLLTQPLTIKFSERQLQWIDDLRALHNLSRADVIRELLFQRELPRSSSDTVTTEVLKIAHALRCGEFMDREPELINQLIEIIRQLISDNLLEPEDDC